MSGPGPGRRPPAGVGPYDRAMGIPMRKPDPDQQARDRFRRRTEQWGAVIRWSWVAAFVVIALAMLLGTR